MSDTEDKNDNKVGSIDKKSMLLGVLSGASAGTLLGLLINNLALAIGLGAGLGMLYAVIKKPSK
ncbi:MAG: hypothetical protein GY863_07490 [bacterium]|nr:hypothetical protein [bacterium]